MRTPLFLRCSNLLSRAAWASALLSKRLDWVSGETLWQRKGEGERGSEELVPLTDAVWAFVAFSNRDPHGAAKKKKHCALKPLRTPSRPWVRCVCVCVCMHTHICKQTIGTSRTKLRQIQAQAGCEEEEEEHKQTEPWEHPCGLLQHCDRMSCNVLLFFVSEEKFSGPRLVQGLPH